ncbi:MAG: IclR family transcriptional regulator [Pigmentiphaga sp.]|uniref:IclR family transcriptional regulator n=1 Tax=Pigmentiphaga sp. TaxID=1977564 RepID=UPI0029BE4552|nr:IclR family transcriptional regulator [Pigmentiphaga sp.]MDX3906316.1 IclR family transcriptional regulator [Pigmentiphaga sp.]
MSTPPPVERSPDEVAALSRGIAVLRCIAHSPQPLGNRQISDLTGLPKATVSRLAGTLVSLGLLQQSGETERYVLAPGVLEFSSAYLSRLDVGRVAQPHLVALAEHAGGGVLLASRDRLEMVVLSSVRPQSAVVIARVDVGGRLSLVSSAIGRAYMAMLDPAERDALIAGVRLARPDEWNRSETGYHAAMRQAQSEGYCLSLGEWHPELNTIGSAFTGPSGEVYAVTCGGSPITQTRERLLAHVAPALQHCVQAIAAEIGGRALQPSVSGTRPAHDSHH